MMMDAETAAERAISSEDVLGRTRSAEAEASAAAGLAEIETAPLQTRAPLYTHILEQLQQELEGDPSSSEPGRPSQ